MPITKASSSAVAPGAKGDLVVGNATNDSGILGVGANGTVLTADSAEATGLKWATAGGSLSGASVQNTAVQSIPNATETTAVFNNELFDTDNYHDNTTNNSRLTIPTGKSGKFIITGRVWFDINATGIRTMKIYKNGNTLVALGTWPSNSYSSEVVCQLSTFLTAVAGDYFEIAVTQSRGGNLDLLGTSGNPGCNQFSIVYMGA